MATLYGYDKTIKAGDLIRAYHKGIHRVTDIERRTGNTPLFYYEKVLTHNWKPVTAQIVDCCDASWCQKVTPKSFQMEIDDFIRQYQEAAVLLFGDKLDMGS